MSAIAARVSDFSFSWRSDRPLSVPGVEGVGACSSRDKARSIRPIATINRCPTITCPPYVRHSNRNVILCKCPNAPFELGSNPEKHGLSLDAGRPHPQRVRTATRQGQRLRPRRSSQALHDLGVDDDCQ